ALWQHNLEDGHNCIVLLWGSSPFHNLINGVVLSNRSTSTAPCFRSNLAATSDHGQHTAA
ncbi:MAG: hypothetical protein H9847_03880, partial [Candidatus Anaerobiospirillum pullicola]|nr:hypothetical protein [Candidatus Anaerobiospirillum pullicola]